MLSLGLAQCSLFHLKLGDNKELTSEGDEEATEEVAASPEEIYQQSCIGCHGDQYQGGVGPALTGVGERLSEEEIVDVLTNGKGAMPGDLSLVKSKKWLNG